MQPSVAVPPSQPSPSFAGFLAAFAQPEKKFPPTRDDEGLADDIVTLSYEHALRTHGRYRPSESPEAPAGQAGQDNPVAAPAGHLAASRVESSSPSGASASTTAPGGSPLMEQNFKRASITIRLSQSDCAQLHQRAAEAGLTVSAYLRSCTLEIESLRAQVKETLAQVRSVTSGQISSNQIASNPAPHKPTLDARRFWSRLWASAWPLSRSRVVPA